jgi:hypothetical protein
MNLTYLINAAVNIALCGIYYFSPAGQEVALPAPFRRGDVVEGGDKPPHR